MYVYHFTEVTVEFSSNSYTVFESSNQVEIMVELVTQGTLDQNVIVQVDSADGSAVGKVTYNKN